jgi:hypothetical protein
MFLQSMKSGKLRVCLENAKDVNLIGITPVTTLYQIKDQIANLSAYKPAQMLLFLEDNTLLHDQ